MSAGPVDRRAAFRRGIANAFKLPGIVLMISMFGFGAFAQASGLGMAPAMLTTASIWALPTQVVLADSWANGAGLLAAALAVTLTSIRLMPMTVALMPTLRGPTTPIWLLMVASHFIAVTVWVESMRRLPDMERDLRMPFYFGMGLTLLAMNTMFTGVGYHAASTVPPLIAGAMLFLTPIYFLLSMILAARERTDLLAIAIGVVLGPLFYMVAPGLELILTGLVGGTLAYVVMRLVGRGRT